ncbi:MAG: hypothetical protein HOI41_10995 [Acidimicrobiaceae bacterium]|jgi:hypothetical protein|nr:hypothetical protein [Acidimicrobiaceae bacterium]
MMTSEMGIALATVVVVMMSLYLVGRNERAASPDESYLWYGAQETLRRRVPLRDFRGYEPGRYWFVAPFERIRPGIRSTRFAATFFLAVCVAVMTATMVTQGYSLFSCAIFAVGTACWSFLPSKRFDQGLMLLLAAACSWMLAAGEATSWFWAGLVVGLAAVFGANHALYGALAVGFTAVLSASHGDSTMAAVIPVLAIGFVVGAAPLWFAMLTVRGLLRAFISRRVGDTTRRGSTNLGLPYPVPGAGRGHPSTQQLPGQRVRLNSLFFTVAPASALVLVIWAAADWPMALAHPIAVGSSVAGLASWHHVLSRADNAHLGTVFPVFIAAAAALVDAHIALAGLLILTLGAGSWFVSIPMHGRVRRATHPSAFVRPSVAIADGLWFLRSDLPVLQHAQALTEQHPHDQPWIAIPTSLWILPLCQRRSAVYDTFCVYPASGEAQSAMINEIESAHPPVAFIATTLLDRREDLTFSRTHPQVWAYINSHFSPVDGPEPSGITVLETRPDTPT